MHNFFNSFTDLIGYSPSKLTYSFLYVHSENLVLQQDDSEHLMLFPLLITCLLQDLKLFEGGTCLSNELKS